MSLSLSSPLASGLPRATPVPADARPPSQALSPAERQQLQAAVRAAPVIPSALLRELKAGQGMYRP